MKKQIENIIDIAIKKHEIMGANILVYKDGKEIVYCERGLADYENNKPIRRNTIFRLYSQTKPVTAVAAMILMERGLLDLSQTVESIIPSYKNVKVDVNGKLLKPEKLMTVHDLLKMTSGLVYPHLDTNAGVATEKVFDEICNKLFTKEALTTLEIADKLAECPLLFTPGESWNYGTSADVLGAIIEIVSGERLSVFMKKEIFDPLGMEDTAFWVPQEKQERLAKVYTTVEEADGKSKMILYKGNNLGIRNDMAELPAYEAGGAGLVSTVDDYMKFATMLLNKGTLNGVQILKPATVKYFQSGILMEKQQKAFDERMSLPGHSYGNLMRVCTEPEKSPMLCCKNEYGWDGWLGAYFANFPDEKMTIIMGIQKTDAGTFDLTRKLRNVVISNLKK